MWGILAGYAWADWWRATVDFWITSFLPLEEQPNVVQTTAIAGMSIWHDVQSFLGVLVVVVISFLEAIVVSDKSLVSL